MQRARWICVLLTAAAWACGDPTPDEGTGPATADATNDGQVADVDNDTTVQTDSATTPDQGSAPTDGGEQVKDAGDDDTINDVVEDDVSGEDSGPLPLDCPGGPMCECEVNGDCDNSQCIDTPNGKQCAETCITSCSDEKNFKCATVESTGGDVTTICVPKYGRMCDPCTESKACKSLGLSDSLCVVHGEGGAFCGVGCELDAECQTGFTCKQVTSIEKIKGKQCVPKAPAGSEAEFGDCTCSDAAVKQKLQTACYIENIGNDGKVSLCKGKRVCLVAGLTKCTAPKPEAEVCDGIDNDCDGDTDENSCDDSNACTTDACKSEGKCIHIDMSGTPCNADDNVCTANDACQQGLCIPGALKDCNDNNPCTKDACDMATGCTKSNDNGAPCDDDNPCTVGDTCNGGSCDKGKSKDCSTGNSCVAGSCSPSDGKCKYVDQAKGTPCEDGNVCTIGDGCSGKGNACLAGSAKDCNDGKACTTDSCAAKEGCKHVANSIPCDDGAPCTLNDVCKDGKCTAGPGKVCDDKEGCTVDSCEPKSGDCQYLGLPLQASPCNADDSACTKGDACNGGKCQAGKQVICDDGNMCTLDACEKGTGKCLHDAQKMQGKSCNADGSKCTNMDSCKSGKCTAGGGLPCDDGNACTDDSCNSKAGCVHKANTALCDDGDACTVGDLCKATKCLAGGPKNCDDNNVCTTDACDNKTGCVMKANVGQQHQCYEGKPDKTKGVGLCKGGVATCDAAGKLSACKGQVLPKPEACDGLDNDCDAEKDEGCKAGLWEFTVVPVQLQGKGGGKSVSGNGGRALSGTSAAQGGGKHSVSWALWDWLGTKK